MTEKVLSRGDASDVPDVDGGSDGSDPLGCTPQAVSVTDIAASELSIVRSDLITSSVGTGSRPLAAGPGALLTGCYPPRIGFGQFDGLAVLFPGQPTGLPPTEISLGRLLSSAGYRTQMIGKWHCGDPTSPT